MQFRSGLQAGVVFAGVCLGFPARDLPPKNDIFAFRLCRLTVDVDFHRRPAAGCAGLQGHVHTGSPRFSRRE